MLTIKPLQTADHSNLTQLLDNEKPLAPFSDGFTHILGYHSELVPQARWSAFVSGEFAGCAGYVFAPTDSRAAICSIVIAPRFRRQKIAAELSERLVKAAKKHGATRLLTDIFEHQQAGIQFVIKRGFKEIGQTVGYQLDLTTSIADSTTPPLATELRVITLNQLPRRRLSERLLPIWNQTRPDQPQHWPFSPYSARQLDQELLTLGDISLPHSFAVVSGADQIVAINLNIAAVGGNLFTTYSAVAHAFRGNGLALALKAHLVAHARAEGINLLSAETDKTNRPMRHINERLGYQPVSTLITYQLNL